MPVLERVLDGLRAKCDRLLQKGFEVGLEFTLKHCKKGNVSSYTSWFILSDGLVWWDTSACQYRPVRFGFNLRPCKHETWMALDGHDPVKWVLDAVLEDIEDEEVVLEDYPAVSARVLDTDIIMYDPPPGCSANDVQTFMNFTAQHRKLSMYDCPDVQTLQDAVLSQLDPLLLCDIIRHNMLDATHAAKWKPVAFPAFWV